MSRCKGTCTAGRRDQLDAYVVPLYRKSMRRMYVYIAYACIHVDIYLFTRQLVLSVCSRGSTGHGASMDILSLGVGFCTMTKYPTRLRFMRGDKPIHGCVSAQLITSWWSGKPEYGGGINSVTRGENAYQSGDHRQYFTAPGAKLVYIDLVFLTAETQYRAVITTFFSFYSQHRKCPFHWLPLHAGQFSLAGS